MRGIYARAARRPSATAAYVVLFIAGLAAASPQPAAAAAKSCPNEALRTGPSAALPDCRAYELVSTAQTNNEDIAGGAVVTPAGSPVSYLTSPLEGSPFSAAGGSWLAERTPAGWFSTNTNLLGLEGGGESILGAQPFPQAYSDDGSHKAYVTVQALNAQDTNKALDMYVGGPQSGFTWLTKDALRGNVYGPESKMEYEGSSSDLSTVVFEAHEQLLPEAPAQLAGVEEGREIYQWHNGRLELVSVLPGETTGAPSGAAVGSGPGAGAGEASFHAVSADGSKVFFESPDPLGKPEESVTSQVYVRIGGERTVKVSAPAPGVVDPEGPQAATYVGATPDGAKVFFVSKGALTSSANTYFDTAEDLYQYDVASGTLTDISSAGLAAPEGSQVQGVVGLSANGATVYFVAKAVLSGENREHHTPVEGAANLYLWNGITIDYVTTLNEEDGRHFYDGIWGLRDNTRPADVTGDGKHLAFISLNNLTGYESNGSPEMYEYDATSGTLSCASCNPSGPPNGGGVEYATGITRPNGTPRIMSEDGSRVFFRTAERLVPSAKSGLRNTYEYEDGHQYLISGSGGGGFDTMSADGSDVYFVTRQLLVPSARGENEQLYDARVDGGFPEATAAPPPCRGAECQPPATPPPNTGGPAASSTFNGGENLIPTASSTPKTTKKPRARTRAQKRSEALAACKKRKKSSRRLACIERARKKYGPAKKAGANKGDRVQRQESR
jgi:Tol biopolymer transport system component